LIRYGIILWGEERKSVKILQIQKRVLHSIKESCRSVFKQLKFLTVTALYIFEVLIYIKKIMYLRRNSGIYECNTRRCDFHVPSCNTSLFKTSVMNTGIRLYNKMPTRIKQLDRFRDFKRKLKLFLLDHPFYSLNEFFCV